MQAAAVSSYTAPSAPVISACLAILRFLCFGIQLRNKLLGSPVDILKCIVGGQSFDANLAEERDAFASNIDAQAIRLRCSQSTG